MTNRERMLLAYRRMKADQVPVSPELWYDIGVLIDKNCSWEDICFDRYPLWKAQLSAHRYFGSAAWLIAGPKGGNVDGEIEQKHYYTSEGDLEFHYVGRCPKGTLQWRIRNNKTFYGWMSEHPIKNLERDFAAFEMLFMPEVTTMDLSEIKNSLKGVEQHGIVTAYAGSLFFSFIASHIEGGPGNAILAMLDKENLFRAFQERYVDRIGRVAEKIIDECDPEILIIDNGFSTAGIINPPMYEKWDLPVIKSVSETVHRKGKLLHLHQHGKCMALMDLIVSGNVDLVEPFERPPSGDTPDLGVIKKKYGSKTAIRGNIHSHERRAAGIDVCQVSELRCGFLNFCCSANKTETQDKNPQHYYCYSLFHFAPSPLFPSQFNAHFQSFPTGCPNFPAVSQTGRSLKPPPLYGYGNLLHLRLRRFYRIFRLPLPS